VAHPLRELLLPWAEQPDRTAEIDSRFGPAAWLFSPGQVDPTTGGVTSGNTLGVEVARVGNTFRSTRTSNLAGTAAAGPPVLYLDDFTAIWYGIPLETGSGGSAFSSLFSADDFLNSSNITAGRDSFTFTSRHDSAGPLAEMNVNGTGGFRALSLTAGAPVMLIMTRVGTTASVYINGQQSGSSWTVGGGTAKAFENIRVGAQYYNNIEQSYASAQHAFAAVLRRGLSAAEVLNLGSAPWGLFEPCRIWVPVGAGGGTATVTPTIISSTASIGAHTVARTALAAVTASRIDSSATFGSATVARTSAAAVTTTRISSTVSFGTASVDRTAVATVTTPRIASTVSFGTATVARTSVAAVSPSRIASTATVGSHIVSVAGVGSVNAARIESTVSFGAATVARTAVAAVSPSRIDSTASIPTHTVARSVIRSITPGRIDSSATFGVPSVSSSNTAQIVVGRIESTAIVRSPVVSSAVPGTIGRPVSDTSNSGWVASAGGALYPMLDEVTPDAGDYIVATSVGALCELALNGTSYPGTASQVLKFRASSSTGNSVIVRLKNTGGATVRSATQVLTPVDTEYAITLSPAEIAAITSGALSVQLESA